MVDGTPLLARLGPMAMVLLAVGVAVSLASCGGGSDGGGKVAVEGAAAQRGQALAWSSGCSGCHSEDGTYSSGPTWQGIIGTQVKLKGGGTVLVDDDYLRRSITEPTAQVVDGYWPVMPAVALSEPQIEDLLAYLHALSPDAPATTSAPTSGIPSTAVIPSTTSVP